jgi:hypothetical protein
MMRSWILFVMACATVVIGATLLWSTPAWPQPRCVPAALVDDAMRDAYGERMIAVGAADGKAIHFYANPDTRTWTVIAIDGSGMACSVASGTARRPCVLRGEPRG